MQNKWKSSPRKLTCSCPVYTQSLQVSRAMHAAHILVRLISVRSCPKREATLAAGRKLSSFSNHYSFEGLTFQGGPSNV